MPVTLRPPSFIESARSTRVVRRAGMRPKAMPVSTLSLGDERKDMVANSTGADCPKGRSARPQ